jgi:hypothetical protein
MNSSNQECNICSSEIASAGCICSNQLILIGNICLTSHIKLCRCNHFVIKLPYAISLSSNRILLKHYLFSSQNPIQVSNISSNSSQTEVPKDFNVTGYSLVKDIEYSLSSNFTGLELSKDRYLHLKGYSNSYRYDIINKSVQAFTKPLRSIANYEIANGEIYFQHEARENSQFDLYRYFKDSGRAVKLGQIADRKLTLRYLIHNDYIYIYLKASIRLKIIRRFNSIY